jgi:hypothetical protein
MLAVFGAGDHGQPGGHGAALRGVVGDRVAQLGLGEILIQECAVGPPAMAGGRFGVQCAADDQPRRSDLVDTKQVAVGERPAQLPRPRWCDRSRCR